MNLTSDPSTIAPLVGELLVVSRTCSLWDEDCDEPVASLKRGDVLLVVQVGHSRRPKRLNAKLYRRVLCHGVLGWVHLDNCFHDDSLERRII